MIDYALVDSAIRHYQRRSYTYIEVPWIVPREVVEATLPSGRVPFSIGPDECLVGSAEQSFLAMMLNGTLAPGKYVAASPCFRDDPPDEYHQRTFFKVELLIYKEKLIGTDLDRIIFDATKVSKMLSGKEPELEKTDIGYDLCFNGIEIGSYGQRTYVGGDPKQTFSWTYGTGIALPRFTQALEATPKSFPVTDPDHDAPDGAIVDGYQRVGDRWVPV